MKGRRRAGGGNLPPHGGLKVELVEVVLARVLVRAAEEVEVVTPDLGIEESRCTLSCLTLRIPSERLQCPDTQPTEAF